MLERWLRGELHTPEQRAEMTAGALSVLAGLLAVVVYVRAMGVERGR